MGWAVRQYTAPGRAGSGELVWSSSAAHPLLHLLGELDFSPCLLSTGRCEKQSKYSGF